jgi:hypothetical protein
VTDRAGGFKVPNGIFLYLDVNNKKSIDLAYNHVIYHELYHNYNPNYGIQESGFEAMWFREGFCDWFYRFILYKYNSDEFKKDMEDKISKYENNKYKNITNKEFNEKYKNSNTNTDLELLEHPYNKGFVYCEYLYRRFNKIFIKKYIELIKTILNNEKYNSDKIGIYFDKASYEKYVVNGETISLN